MSQGLFPAHHSFALLDIDLVAQHNKGEVVGVPGRGLDEEFVAPAVEGVKALGVVDVVHEHAAVCAAIEGDS